MYISYSGGNSTYPNKEFIGFDVYSLPGQKVTVTYDGLSVTIPEGSFKEVLFGVYAYLDGGAPQLVDDGTAVQGLITFEGGLAGIRSFGFNTAKGTATFCSTIKSINQFTKNTEQVYAVMFRGQNYLTSITIPNYITSMSNYAIADCINLSTLILLPTTPPVLTNLSLVNIPVTTQIIVPIGTLSTYQSAQY